MVKDSEFENKQSERGSASSNLLIVFAVFLLIGNAGYNYIPVSYQGQDIKQEMKSAVVGGTVSPGRLKPVEAVKRKLKLAMKRSGLPDDAVVQVKEVNKRVTATVSYTTKVNILPFGLYSYEYVFNHTATPASFD